jgi:hypothetical protein
MHKQQLQSGGCQTNAAGRMSLLSLPHSAVAATKKSSYSRLLRACVSLQLPHLPASFQVMRLCLQLLPLLRHHQAPPPSSSTTKSLQPPRLPISPPSPQQPLPGPPSPISSSRLTSRLKSPVLKVSLWPATASLPRFSQICRPAHTVRQQGRTPSSASYTPFSAL